MKTLLTITILSIAFSLTSCDAQTKGSSPPKDLPASPKTPKAAIMFLIVESEIANNARNLTRDSDTRLKTALDKLNDLSHLTTNPPTTELEYIRDSWPPLFEAYVERMRAIHTASKSLVPAKIMEPFENNISAECAHNDALIAYVNSFLSYRDAFKHIITRPTAIPDAAEGMKKTWTKLSSLNAIRDEAENSAAASISEFVSANPEAVEEIKKEVSRRTEILKQQSALKNSDQK